MKGPVCNVDLKMSDRSGVEIDCCPQCRGVWLDRGELDKIIERSAAEFSAPAPASYQRGPDRPYGERDNKARKRKSFLGEMFDFEQTG